MFKRAAKWQLVQHSVIRDVDCPKVVKPDIEVWEDSEVEAILAAAKGMKYEAAVVLALSCGLRGGEIFALKPGDYIRRPGESISTPLKGKTTEIAYN